MNIKQAAARLNKHPHYVRQLLLAGKLAGTKTEAGWDISEAACQAFEQPKPTKGGSKNKSKGFKPDQSGRLSWCHSVEETYTSNPIERYYTVREIANFLDLPKERVIKLLEDDRISMWHGNAYNIGATRVERENLDPSTVGKYVKEQP